MKEKRPIPRKKAGFTMVELLCATVTLVLVAALMVTGVQLAVRAYETSVSMSEAQILCATLKTTVADELRYAGSLRVENDKVVGFFSQNYGDSAFAGFGVDENGQVLLGNKKLLPTNAYPYGLRAAVDMEYQGGIFTVTITVTSRDGETLATAKFDVKKLNQEQN